MAETKNRGRRRNGGKIKHALCFAKLRNNYICLLVCLNRRVLKNYVEIRVANSIFFFSFCVICRAVIGEVLNFFL